MIYRILYRIYAGIVPYKKELLEKKELNTGLPRRRRHFAAIFWCWSSREKKEKKRKKRKEEEEKKRRRRGEKEGKR